VTLAGRYDLVVFDLDGVVYVGAQAVPGAPEAIRALVEAGTPVAYATNNASRRATEVADLLGRLGVPARPEEVVTSARATAELLAGELPPGAPVLPVGAPALGEELAAVGLSPVTRAEDRPVAVVQGYGPNVGWAMLAEACVAIRAGARWVATNPDPTMPSPRGPVPGNGALVAAVATALGREPDTVVGKPAPGLLEAAARRRGARRVLVVGDRLDTDIEGAARAGMDSLLVLTGVATPADLLAAPPHRRPTYVAADLGALSTPDDSVRVPEWAGAVVHAGWRVSLDDRQLVLVAHARAAGDARTAGDAPDAGGDAPDPVGALRALAAAAWQCPQWTAIRVDPAGASALSALGLQRHASPMAESPGSP
jgi:Predicted sugar phosphatases of the HAD superfamily